MKGKITQITVCLLILVLITPIGITQAQANVTIGQVDDDVDEMIANDAVNGESQALIDYPPSYVSWWDFSGALETPTGVAVDSGYVYVLTGRKGAVIKCDADGNRIASWIVSDGNGYPEGIAVDSNYVYVADTGYGRIIKYDTNGVYQGEYGGFNHPKGVAVDAQGNIYVADAGNDRIVKFAPDGTFIWTCDRGDQSDDVTSQPNDIAVVSSGTGNLIYAADTGNNAIEIFREDSTGINAYYYVNVINSDGSVDPFNYPAAVATDAHGNLYVADTYHSRIAQFWTDDIHFGLYNYLTQWGSEGSGNTQFDGPMGIAADGHGNVYVADTDNKRIVKYSDVTPPMVCTPFLYTANGRVTGQATTPDSFQLIYSEIGFPNHISATFNEVIDPLAPSIRATLVDDSGNEIPCSYRSQTPTDISLEPSKTAWFDITGPLHLGTYKATISGVRDLAGNEMTETYTWQFAIIDCNTPPEDVTSAFTPVINILSLDDGGVTFKIDFPMFTNSKIAQVVDPMDPTTTEFDVPTINGLESTGEVGKPSLPIYNTMLSVPDGAQYDTRVIQTTAVAYNDQYLVYPAQGSSGDTLPLPPFSWDHEFYATDQLYPESIVSIGPADSSNVASLMISPLQYNPVSGKLTFYSSITARLEFSGQTAAVTDSLPDWVLVNPEARGVDFIIVTDPSLESAADRLAERRNSEGLSTIVRTTNYLDTAYGDSDGTCTNEEIKAFLQYAYDNWVPKPSYVLLLGDDHLVPTFHHTKNSYAGNMYAQNSMTGTDLYYAILTGRPECVLPTIPEPITLPAESPPYYDEYWTPDLAVGRIPVDTLAEADVVINKIFDYEDDQWNSNSQNNLVTLLSYFQDGEPDTVVVDGFDLSPPPDGIEDKHFIHTQEVVEGFFTHEGLDVERLYTLNTGITPTINPQFMCNMLKVPVPLPQELLRPNYPWDADTSDIINSFNDGRSLIIYRGHGAAGTSTTGRPDSPNGVDRGPAFTVNDISSLTNINKLPVVFYIACELGYFDSETDGVDHDTHEDCLGEQMLKYDAGGAVGVIAASRISQNGPNEQLEWGLIKAIWPNFRETYYNYEPQLIDPNPISWTTDVPYYRMGDILNYGKNNMRDQYYSYVRSDRYGKYVGESEEIEQYEVYNYLGDPTMMVKVPNRQMVVADPYISQYYSLEGQTLQLRSKSLALADGDTPNNRITRSDWDLDYNGDPDVSGGSPLIAVYDDYSGPVTLTVTDAYGNIDTAVTRLTILNVAPTVEAGQDLTLTNGVLEFNGDFADPGLDDNWTYQLDFGDGSPIQTGSALQTAPLMAQTMSGSMSATTQAGVHATHRYPDNGVYTVTLTITDDDGGIGTDTMTVTVANAPSIALDKVTNGADGQNILVGSPVTWTYTITNTGAMPLSNIAVTDNIGVTPAYVSGDVNGNSMLDLDEAWIYAAAGIAAAGSYENTGTATGTYEATTVIASDTSSYFGADPQIAIAKVTNNADGKTILVGSPVTWTYTVTNTGNVPLSNVAVTDNVTGVTTAYKSGDANNDGKLDLTETWVYEASGTASAGPYANTGTASGSFTDGSGATRTCTASDMSSYFGADPQIAIAKVTNGADGNAILVGSPVTWTYTVTNAGNVPLSNVQVTDDKGITPAYVSGDANGNNVLDLGETWVYAAAGTATYGSYANTGTASGSYTDDLGNTGTDSAADTSSYFGTLATYTQGGYAGKGAPGKLLNTYFSTAFPTGLEIGQYTAATGYGDLWTASTSLKSFMTNAGTPGNITKDALNPTNAKNGGGTLASQTAALTVNIAFSGLVGTNMPAGYGTLVYVSPDDSLKGKTVAEIRDVANIALSTGTLPTGYTYGTLTALVENLNEAFDNGVPTNWARDHLKSSL